MEAEQLGAKLSGDLAGLPDTLRATYTEVINESRQKHEAKLKALRQQHGPETFMSLYEIMNASEKYDDNLRNAAGVQLKSVSYDLTVEILPSNTSEYLGWLYKLITKQAGMTRLQREYVGTAIEYFLNKDDRKPIAKLVNLYRGEVLAQLAKEIPETLLPGTMLGLLEVYKAFIDGLSQISDLEIAFEQTFHLLKGIGQKYLAILKSQSKHPVVLTNDQSLREQPIYTQLLGIFHTTARLFQIIEIILGRLMDEYQDVMQTIDRFRVDAEFRRLMYDYLMYPFQENNARGILTTIGVLKENINEVKQFIMRLLVIAYDDLPLEMLFLCIQTFVVENGRHHNQSKPAEEVMMAVIDILEMQLKRPLYYQLFSKVCIDMIIKSMSYLKHTGEDQELLESTPQEYLEIFNDSCLSFNKRFVRTKVCSLLTGLAGHVDGMLNFVASMMNLLLRFSLQEEVAPEIQYLIESIKQYEIYNDAIPSKIDVGLYLVCMMQLLVGKNEVLSSNVRHLIVMCIHNEEVNASPHMVIKCMYAIGGYRMHGSAPWVLAKMRQTKLYEEQGVYAFSQLLRGKLDQASMTQSFVDCLVEVVDMIDPATPLFETLVLNNYHELLGHSNNLHHKCIRKVVHYLSEAISSQDEGQAQTQKDIAIFNMLEGIIQKELDMMRLLELEREFSSVALIKSSRSEHSEHILTIMSTILKRTANLTEYQRKFVAGCFQLGCHVTGDLLLYLNRIVCFEQNSLNLTSIVDVICPMMERLQQNGEQNLIGQAAIVLGQSLIRIRETTPAVINIVKELVPVVKFDITKVRLLGLLMTSLEVSPEHALHLLTETPGWTGDGTSLYEEAIIRCPLAGVCLESNLHLDRKIYVAGLCKAIDCEKLKGRNPRSLIISVARMLQTFIEKSKIKPKSHNNERGKRKQPETKNRRFESDDEEHMTNDVGRQVAINNCSIMDLQTNHLLKFQHPLSDLNDLEMFQHKLLELRDFLQRELSPQQLSLIRELLCIYEDKQGRTRKIARLGRI